MDIKTLLRKVYNRLYALVPKPKLSFQQKLQLDYEVKSFSFEGEDIILEKIFAKQGVGFYVDVGAHHPVRFSNTYKLYLKGWSGINIDPLPGSMLLFNKVRPRDINLELGISMERKELNYYQFNEGALNTFDSEEAKKKDGLGEYKISAIKKIPTVPLRDVLEAHLPTNTEIDLMSIDVEGFDLEVLKSNNWDIYRPKYLFVEELRTDVETLIETSELYSYLRELNYRLWGRTYNTSIYKTNLDEVK